MPKEFTPRAVLVIDDETLGGRIRRNEPPQLFCQRVAIDVAERESLYPLSWK
jgi:hypothetical protein